MLPTLLLFVWSLMMVHGKRTLSSGDKVRLADTDAGREAAAAGINCPSVTEDFRKSSSIKCDGCHVIAVSLTYRLVREKQLPEEATEALCDDMMSALLRQKVNGRRFWVPPHKNRGAEGDEIDKVDAEAENATTITLTGMEPRSGAAPTYHDDYEQRVLPCAPYLLRRMCHRRVEENDDAVEACVTPYRARSKKRGVAAMDIKPYSDAESQILECFSKALGCQSGGCYERAVLKEREAERVRFLKFEGAFGSTAVPLVEDEETPGLMVRNPYARGGEKERHNELLKRRPRGGQSDL